MLVSINQRAEQLLHFHACLLFKLGRLDREGDRDRKGVQLALYRNSSRVNGVLLD